MSLTVLAAGTAVMAALLAAVPLMGRALSALHGARHHTATQPATSHRGIR